MGNVARIVTCLILMFAIVAPARAASLRAGMAAYNREDFNAAATIFRPLALAGDARAQSYLGYMYSTGRGVPQDYESLHRTTRTGTQPFWYCRL